MPSRSTNSSRSSSRLASALARLIGRPKRLSAQKLWNALKEEERVEALKSFVQQPEGRRTLVATVAERLNFRQATVARWNDSKIIQWTQTLGIGNPVANSLLHAMHLHRRREMLAHFLNALEVPNDDGLLIANNGERAFEMPDLEEPVVHAAANDLADEYGLRRVVVYFLTLTMDKTPFGVHLWTWMGGLLEPAEPDAQTDLVATTHDDEDEEEAESDDDPGRHRSFTTLDRLLVYAVVDSKQEVVRSLNEDQVDDAVEEFVKLNGRRQHSYFHLGLRDVLFDRSLGEALSDSNRDRKRWYWAGAIQGWARLESWGKIVSAYDDNSVIRRLGDGRDFATDAAARHVVRALRHVGRSAEVANFGKVEGIKSSRPLFQETLKTGTRLLRNGDAAGARSIFDRLMEVVLDCEQKPGFPPVYGPFLTVRRRRAHCLQRLLEHGRARRLLEDLLDLDPDLNHLAMVHADLGLLAGGFNSLDDVRLPTKGGGELRDHVDRLKKGEEHFRRSVKCDVEYAAHGHYCLGVLVLGENVHASEEARFGEAEYHLARARAQFRRRPNRYDSTLINRTNLYLGISRASRATYAGLSGDLTQAVQVMVEALRAGASCPPYLLAQAIDVLSAGAGAEDWSNLGRALLDTLGSDALDVLSKSESILEHCGEVVSRLRQRAHQRGDSGPAAADLRVCLASYQRAKKQKEAKEALDCLHALAMQRIGLDEFRGLLSERAGYDPGWTPAKARIALAQYHELDDDYEKACEQLRPLVHEYASKGRVDRARGVLDRIGGYPLSVEYFERERKRVEELEGQATIETPTAPPTVKKEIGPINVLFVGGDEGHQKKQQAVLEKVKQRAPHVGVTFITTGWSGNWRKHLDDVRARLPNHDAVVVMSFMRTELGKQVREACGSTPWRSCWGASGQQGMTDAILAAAEAAREADQEK